MRGRTLLFILIAALFLLINGKTVIAEEVMKGGAVPQSEGAGDIQWVWGDVVNVDTQNKALTVKYLDYETDQEKEISVSIDDKTTFENIKALGEVKAGDVVSVDYSASSDGSNIAKNISVEKPEAMTGMQEPGMEEEMPMTQE
ncbi:MAG: hypothetical protein ABIG31_03110 [Candidatus Omnitrophota bacterium]